MKSKIRSGISKRMLNLLMQLSPTLPLPPSSGVPLQIYPIENIQYDEQYPEITPQSGAGPAGKLLKEDTPSLASGKFKALFIVAALIF